MFMKMYKGQRTRSTGTFINRRNDVTHPDIANDINKILDHSHGPKVYMSHSEYYMRAYTSCTELEELLNGNG